jgi:hypothetical protein
MDRAALAPFAVVFALSAVFFGVVLACSSSGAPAATNATSDTTRGSARAP